MSESVERLAMLRFLLRVQEQDLARTRRWLEQEEQAAVAQGRKRAEEEARRRPEGDWILSAKPSPKARIWLHAGHCWDLRPGMIPVTRDQAVEALTRGGVQPCPACHPDTDLGVLE